MLRVLYSDMRASLLNKGIRILALVFATYLIGYVIIMSILLHVIAGNVRLNADDVLTVYNETSIFVITAATLIIYVNEFMNGTIRNKLCSGSKRSEIFLAAIINSAFMATLLAIMCQTLELILSLIFTNGLYGLTLADAAYSFSETTISGIAIAIFSTSLIMMMGGTNASYVVGLGIALAFKVFGLSVQQKLYPEKGLVSIKGAKLAIYTFYDRFVPYAHCSGTPRWTVTDVSLGCAVLILLSIITGLIVFNKKELK